MVSMSMIHSIDFAKTYTQPAPGGDDSELWLIYMTTKDQTPTQYTQQFMSAYKCFDCNFNGTCTRTHCQYSHTCSRCVGMHTFVCCNQNRQQFYAYYGQMLSKLPFCSNTNGSTHIYGFSPQQQQWRQEQYSSRRLNYRVTPPKKGS